MNESLTVIAATTLRAQRPGGAEFALQLSIHRPTPSAKMAPAWECVVALPPLWAQPFAIYGEDAVQALCLACRHAAYLLDSFVAKGGVLLHPDGTAFEAKALGFNMLPDGA